VRVPTSRLQLHFRLWGAQLDPESVTSATGVEPSRSFHVGERRGKAANPVAGWEWNSAWGDDEKPLLAEMLQVLGPHSALLRRCVDEGADAWVAIVGTVSGTVIDTPELAEAGSLSTGDPFEPFFDGDRVALMLDREVVAFLASIGASVTTHIDAVLEDEDTATAT
jgi:hypothetical protein